MRYLVVNTGSVLKVVDSHNPAAHVKNFPRKQKAAARDYVAALNEDDS